MESPLVERMHAYLQPANMQNKAIQYQDLGTRKYKEVWDMQENLLAEIVALKIQNRGRSEETALPTPNYLLLVEHLPVFTLGKSGAPENLLVSESFLEKKGIDYFHINRGGDITFHGPGQVVGYPIFDLENFYTDIHRYLREIEEIIINVLKFWHLKGERVEGRTGVWVNDKKICAIGVRTSRWVTMHGFALNVNSDLNYFKQIIPCGISDKEVTSMAQELEKQIEMEEVKALLVKEFSSVFKAQVAQKL